MTENKFNVDSPDWFNIYSDDLVLGTKVEIKEGEFLYFKGKEYDGDLVEGDIVRIKSILEKKKLVLVEIDGICKKIPLEDISNLFFKVISIVKRSEM